MFKDGSTDHFFFFKENCLYVPEMRPSIFAYELLAWVFWVVQDIL